MGALRIYLSIIFVVILGYTSVTIANHGMNLLPVFFGDIAALTWNGQFNMDFLGFLLLSGLWVAWRHHFSVPGLGLGLVAVFGGMLFLCTYLLVALAQVKGDAAALLLGPRRAGGGQ